MATNYVKDGLNTDEDMAHSLKRETTVPEIPNRNRRATSTEGLIDGCFFPSWIIELLPSGLRFEPGYLLSVSRLGAPAVYRKFPIYVIHRGLCITRGLVHRLSQDRVKG